MKKLAVMFCALAMLMMLAGSAGAAYVSSFDVAGDFSVTGFSEVLSTGADPTATNGPDTVTISNPTGTYNLEVPPAGVYDWYIEFDSLTLDFFGDSTPELAFSNIGPYFLGTYAAPVPGLTGSYNFGDVYIPQYTEPNSGVTVGGYTVENLVVGWDITMSGTDITQIDFTVNANNLSNTVNEELTYLDNEYGGANGVIDGHATAAFRVTANPVPEPSTIMLMGFGLLGLLGYGRKRFMKK